MINSYKNLYARLFLEGGRVSWRTGYLLLSVMSVPDVLRDFDPG